MDEKPRCNAFYGAINYLSQTKLFKNKIRAARERTNKLQYLTKLKN